MLRMARISTPCYARLLTPSIYVCVVVCPELAECKNEINLIQAYNDTFTKITTFYSLVVNPES